MQCENCGQRPATIHQTVIANGQKQESHLCEVCAQENGQIFSGSAHAFPNLSIHQLLASFMGQEMSAGSAALSRRQAAPRCASCGLTYSEFADSGRLGCADCYDQLEPHLVPLIKRIHGTTVHSGKVPKRAGGVVRQKRELEGFKQQLNEAIHQERYEDAVRLRDAMRTLQAQIEAGGEGGAVE
jgi:protein arginine kinase activator